MPTETGNPPVIDESAVQLTFDDDSIIVEGASGAVEPGAAVRVENQRTGGTGETSADASGAFVVELEGDVDDPLSIHVTTSEGSSSVQLATQPSSKDAGEESSASSSNEQLPSGADVMMSGEGSASELPTCESGVTSSVTVSGVNNYAYASEPSYELAIVNSGVELTLDWSELTRDSVGRPLDATRDVAMLTLLLVNLPAPDAMARLHEGTLLSSDLVAALTHSPGVELAAKLTMFSVLGSEIGDSDVAPFFEPGRFPKDAYTYVFAASSSTTLGLDLLAYQPFQLSEDAESDRVLLSDASVSVDYSVDLTSSDPLRVPSDVSELQLHLALETDAHGRPFDGDSIDRLTIARYDSLSGSDLQGAFFEMEQLADETWSADASRGSDLRFAEFVDASGNSLPLLSRDDTWVLVAPCTSCPDRAPSVVTFLEECIP